jgi:hypothetical protein
LQAPLEDRQAVRVLQVLVQAHTWSALFRRMLASVALRTSIGSRRRSSPFSSNRSKAYRNAWGSFLRWRRSWNEVTPFSSQHTTSPSITQDRLALETYRAAVKRWPGAKITLRNRARVIEQSWED